MLNNLAIVYSNEKDQQEILQIARKSYENTIFIAFDVLRAYFPERAPLKVRFEGEEHLLKAQADTTSRGLYLACGHTGNWEFMGEAVAKNFGAARVVVKKVGPPVVDRFVSAGRRRRGFLAIERNKPGDGLKQMIRTVLSKELLAVVCDQYKPGGVTSKLFGVETKTNQALPLFWQRYPGPVIPTRCYRESNDGYVVVFSKPLDFKHPEESEDYMDNNISQINGMIENQMKSSPESYFWFHRRWK